jgi:demethylmenaquinone methyltransferase/2-methoxy-6-polyprenyl-1,4-benzoquinol methylase
MRVLDLAGGTGTSAEPLAAAGAKVTVCDISTGMLQVGRSRFPNIDFVQGDALELPFESASFQVATVSFGLRNTRDPAVALRELARVVEPGGRLVILEFSHPRHVALRAAYQPYLRYVLPTVAGVITGDRDSYEYFAESIKQWPNQHELVELMTNTGWDGAKYRDLTGGIVALHEATRPLDDVAQVDDGTQLDDVARVVASAASMADVEGAV